jgi:hypothetical protein
MVPEPGRIRCPGLEDRDCCPRQGRPGVWSPIRTKTNGRMPTGIEVDRCSIVMAVRGPSFLLRGAETSRDLDDRPKPVPRLVPGSGHDAEMQASKGSFNAGWLYVRQPDPFAIISPDSISAPPRPVNRCCNHRRARERAFGNAGAGIAWPTLPPPGNLIDMLQQIGRVFVNPDGTRALQLFLTIAA